MSSSPTKRPPPAADLAAKLADFETRIGRAENYAAILYWSEVTDPAVATNLGGGIVVMVFGAPSPLTDDINLVLDQGAQTREVPRAAIVDMRFFNTTTMEPDVLQAMLQESNDRAAAETHG